MPIDQPPWYANHHGSTPSSPPWKPPNGKRDIRHRPSSSSSCTADSCLARGTWCAGRRGSPTRSGSSSRRDDTRRKWKAQAPGRTTMRNMSAVAARCPRGPPRQWWRQPPLQTTRLDGDEDITLVWSDACFPVVQRRRSHGHVRLIGKKPMMHNTSNIVATRSVCTKTVLEQSDCSYVS